MFAMITIILIHLAEERLVIYNQHIYIYLTYSNSMS